MVINRENTCLACGTKIVPAGISNQIDGRRYHGRRELADEEWVVCPKCYEQNLQTGDWQKNS